MHSVIRQVKMINRCHRIFFRDHCKDESIRFCAENYICCICKNPGISQDEISKRLYIEKSAVARHLAQMEESGLIERRRSARDKRVLEVYPTQKLLGVQPDILRMRREWSDYLMADFSEEDVETLNRMLERMVVRAQAYVDGRGE